MKVNIPEPCHEDWNKMDTQEKGRFCGSCQKLVIDFTAMSDSEIVNYFKAYKSENTCGHFKKTQIERNLKPQETPRRKLFLKELAAACFAFFLASTDAKAQGEIIVNQQHQNSETENQGKEVAINGIVKNGNENLSNAIISIKGTEHKTISLENGLFSIHIPYEIAQNQEFVILKIEHQDFRPKEIEVATSPTNQFVEINFSTRKTTTKLVSGNFAAVEETITIKGTVTDDTGVLPAATIQIKGTNKGVITDMEGNYSLVVPYGSILVFRYVGYESQEVKIEDKIVIDVKLESGNLDGMIVVGGASVVGVEVTKSKWYSPRNVWYKIKNIFR